MSQKNKVRMEIQESADLMPIIEIKPQEVNFEEVDPEVENHQETIFHKKVTLENEIQAEFRDHVAVQNENIIEILPEVNKPEESTAEQQGSVKIHECAKMTKNPEQVELKTEYQFITVEEVEAMVEPEKIEPGRRSLEKVIEEEQTESAGLKESKNLVNKKLQVELDNIVSTSNYFNYDDDVKKAMSV